ncbi:lipid biosynthesis B12-binding/radical SAM protein [bacterium]|nr:lipid biosynthesis B12-binding/radical SAM protein [bacterium]
MRVLLISTNIAKTPYPVYPLGLGIVAAALADAGHEVRLFDFLASGRSHEALRGEIEQFSPEVIGVSVRNIDNVNALHEERYIDAVKVIMQSVKQKTNAPIVLGGSGFSLMPQAIMKTVGADYGIVGEGETAMVEFVDRLKTHELPPNSCITAPPSLLGDEMPSARYEDKIMSYYLKSGRMAPVQTKRGCPHKCVYCSYPLLEGAAIRSRNTVSVVDDIEMLKERHGAEYIFFTDSVFNDDGNHYLELMREMRSRELSVPWTAFFKPTGLNDEAVLLMKQTGLKAAEIGSDGTTDTTLRGLGKGFSFKDIAECNDLFNRHDIATAHFFLFGGPGETKDTVLRGIEDLQSLQPAVLFAFMGIRILPNTPLAKIASRDGIISPETDLLTPTYYLAPDLDSDWLRTTLTNAFSGMKHGIFPADALDDRLHSLHEMGFTGTLWDMLLSGEKRRRGRGRRDGE